MTTKKYIIEYTQTQVGAYSDPITRFNAREFDTENAAKHFLLDLMVDDMWDLDEYKFIIIEEWRNEKDKETKLAIEILKKLLTN